MFKVLTERMDDNKMSMSKIESKDDRFIVSHANFKDHLQVSFDRKIFKEYDEEQINNYINSLKG
jgi:hypothetical protein